MHSSWEILDWGDVSMLIILDRDGVINHESVEYVKSSAEWIPIAGSLAAIARLTQGGHRVVVATNQAGVGRGYYSLATLHDIHETLRRRLIAQGGWVEGIYYCPHTPDDQCDCRKPKPGLLQAIARDYPRLFSQAIFIGDSWRDVEAARAAGIQPLLVRTGYGEESLARDTCQSVLAFADLAAAVDYLLQNLHTR